MALFLARLLAKVCLETGLGLKVEGGVAATMCIISVPFLGHLVLEVGPLRAGTCVPGGQHNPFIRILQAETSSAVFINQQLKHAFPPHILFIQILSPSLNRGAQTTQGSHVSSQPCMGQPRRVRFICGAAHRLQGHPHGLRDPREDAVACCRWPLISSEQEWNLRKPVPLARSLRRFPAYWRLKCSSRFLSPFYSTY